MIVTASFKLKPPAAPSLAQHHPVRSGSSGPLASPATASCKVDPSPPRSAPPTSSSTPTPLSSLPAPSALPALSSSRRALPLLLALASPALVSLLRDLLGGKDTLHSGLLPHRRVLGRDLGFASDGGTSPSGGEFDVEETGGVGHGEGDVVQEEGGLKWGGRGEPAVRKEGASENCEMMWSTS